MSILKKLALMPQVRIGDPRISEYRLMYRFGAWVTKQRIYAEDDDEAVFDAKAVFEADEALRRWPYEVAVFQGSRRVALLKKADGGTYM